MPSSEQQIEDAVRIQAIFYTISGVIVLGTSFMSTVVYASSKDFVLRFSIFLALSIADFINGLGYIIAAMGRLYFVTTGNFHKPLYTVDCFTKTPWAIPRLVSTQLPAYLHILLALERVCSACCFQFYHRHWDFRLDCIQILLAVLLTAIFVSMVFLFQPAKLLSNRMCNIIQSAGPVFGPTNVILITVLYLSSFVILVLIYRKINVSRVSGKVPTKEAKRKQNVVISITVISVLFVTIPSIIQLLKEWNVIESSDFLVGTINTLFCLHSSTSFPIYMKFRPEFRQRFKEIFCCRKIKNTSQATIFMNNSSSNGTSTNRQTQVPMFQPR